MIFTINNQVLTLAMPAAAAASASASALPIASIGDVPSIACAGSHHFVSYPVIFYHMLCYVIICHHMLTYLIISLSYNFLTGDIPTLTRTGAAPENDFHEIEVQIQIGNGHDLGLGQHGYWSMGNLVMS